MKFKGAKLSEQAKQRASVWLSTMWPGLIVALIGALLTAGAVRWELRQHQAQEQARANARLAELQAAIESRIGNYTQVLRAGVALFQTGRKVERAEWAAFVKGLAIDQGRPGMFGVGYAQWLTEGSRKPFLEQMRKSGAPQFDLRPAGQRDRYAPITFLEPANERSRRALGFDMLAEPTRHKAIWQAVHSGLPAITGKLRLGSEPDDSAALGFLLFLPIYRPDAPTQTHAQRESALQGLITSPIRIDDLMLGILGDNPDGASLRVFDGSHATADTQFYAPARSAQGDALGLSFAQSTVDIHGRPWTIELTMPRSSAGAIDTNVGLIMASGGLITLLAAALATLIVNRMRMMRWTERHYFRLANYDTLTALPNRSMFAGVLESGLKKAAAEGRTLALLFVDLDNFKDVNDTLGHAGGDVLLREVAARLSRCIGEGDMVCRLGGDEFTVMLRDVERGDAAATVANAIVSALESPFQVSDEHCFVSASIGITLYPHDGDTAATLLRNADQAMYAAKKLGRNRFLFYSPALQVETHARLHLKVEMRAAIERQEFFLVYQPIVNLGTGRIVKAEALIRWQNPRLGLIAPQQFIAQAEETGLINRIGSWAFEETCRSAAQWRRNYHAEFQVSVNVSPVQLRSVEHAISDWPGKLSECELTGQAVAVEITEGTLLDINRAATSSLLALRDAGIQVALDDFGTGYSSLAYLRRLDIDYLKIDKSFVQSLKPDSDDLALCSAIIVMAHKLGLKVVAEGIETSEQRDLLISMGCDFGQGFLFARPLRAEQFETLLKTHTTFVPQATPA